MCLDSTGFYINTFNIVNMVLFHLTPQCMLKGSRLL
uniref:Uncharacterized protein n=1 Tax=Anguilla anguilla TaxID=7936 RepID=A0A0E9T0H1_ANGAN